MLGVDILSRTRSGWLVGRANCVMLTLETALHIFTSPTNSGRSQRGLAMILKSWFCWLVCFQNELTLK